jgi:hypothetical protein
MKDYETGRCDAHGIEVAVVSKSYAEEHGVQYGCPACREDLATRPGRDQMTREQRCDELRTVLGANWAGFDVVWQRVDELVGRSTYTHELAYPEYLEHEIMTGSVPTVEGIIAKLPADKPVIVVRADAEDSS